VATPALGDRDRTVEDLLESNHPVRAPLADALYGLLTDEPQSVAASLARAVGRDPKDGSVRNALNKLEKEKRSRKIEKGWVRCSW
jgi:hypothetical protein